MPDTKLYKYNEYLLYYKKSNNKNIYRNEKLLTGKEEQISAIAIPTNHVKKDTRTHPHTRVAGPAYKRLEPYRGVMPVKRVIVENDIARVLNRFCKEIPRSLL